MKLFWSESVGYIIGSPNLSSNALGTSRHEARLLEIARYSPVSSEIRIDAILEELDAAGATRVTDSVLASFSRQYYSSPAFEEDDATILKPPSFSQFLAQRSPQPFRFAPWTESSLASAVESRAASDLFAAVGVDAPPERVVADSIVVPVSFEDGEWILAYRVGPVRVVRSIAWIFQHLHVSGTEAASEHVALQVASRRRPMLPFSLGSSQFRQRFSAYLRRRLAAGQFPAGAFDRKRFEEFERRSRR
jgi:hypothetical protein